MKHVALFVLVGSSAVSAPAAADPSLVLTREPSPRTLRMRPKTLAQKPTPPPKPKTPMPAAPTATATQPGPIDGLEGLRDVTVPLSFSVTAGYQVDGARLSDRAWLGGRPLPSLACSRFSPACPKVGTDFADLRAYGFAEGFLSTRGVGISSLETYFALRFQAARTITVPDFDLFGEPTTSAVPSPIATWFERSGLEVRSGWAEMRDFLPKRWRLSKLRVRAGSQYIYGPWILHLDGLHIAYEGPTVTMSLYSGTRHSDYTREQTDNRPVAGGASLKIDLRGLTTRIPISIRGEVMSLTKSTETGEENVDTSMVQVDWRPRRDIVVLGQMRGVNGDIANQRVEVRTRYKEVTNFVFDLSRRLIDDWRWDPSLVSRPTQPFSVPDKDPPIVIDTEARRYLDLGRVLPQLIFSARAGTLFRENIDVVGRIALATDEEDGSTPVPSHIQPYVEVGGGVEIRLRRQFAVGVSVLSRQQTERETPPVRVSDDLGPQPLPGPDVTMAMSDVTDSSLLGEEGFFELGATVKMTLGARRFSAMVEAYGRNTRYTHIYEDASDPLPARELHGGGRFTVDAWIGRRVKLFASYDVSTQLDAAPEISGYKSLRMMVTGIY